MWGRPNTLRDIANLFVAYMEGKVEALPWSESPISKEADELRDGLVDLNRRGFLTINSQPAVDGARSSHPVYGWGPRNGYVYQKAYLEVLVSPEVMSELVTRVERDPDLTYYAVNREGDLRTNAPGEGPNAITWGVFPGKEITQPTIVETVSFLAWKDEFFRLGADWASCYDAASPSRYLINGIMDTWFLINIVHNDFHVPNGIFPLFDGLEVAQLEQPVLVNGYAHANGNATDEKAQFNGSKEQTGANGTTHGAVVNGTRLLN